MSRRRRRAARPDLARAIASRGERLAASRGRGEHASDVVGDDEGYRDDAIAAGLDLAADRPGVPLSFDEDA